MEKKRSVGVTIASILSLIAGLLICKNSLDHFVFSYRLTFGENLYSNYRVIVILLFGLGYTISSIFLFRLKKWAKNLFLFLTLIYLIFGLFSITGYFSIEEKPLFNDIGYLVAVGLCFVLPSLIIFYFFTRPKVKEQFN